MKTTGLSFIEAVKAAKGYNRIRQAGWYPEISCLPRQATLHFPRPDGQDCVVLADELTMNTWEVVPEPPKTMSFTEAWEHAKQGRSIAQISWSKGAYAKLETNSYGVVRLILHSQRITSTLLMCTEYVDANNWIVVETENNDDSSEQNS